MAGIKSGKWTANLVDIVYHCACSNLVHIEVYESGQVSISAEPLNDSVEKQDPTVNVTWEEGRVDIESRCVCNAGCRFTRRGRSVTLQFIN